ncbi:hypothetical protein P7C71_g2871, partial [Lecanoromycetidae sp. Uapishka_2]
MASLTHEERTFAEFRQSGLHKVVLDKIDQVNHNVRLLRLKPKSPEEKKSIKFLPGQWLDVHVPGIAQAGGFTITSAPEHLEKDDGYLELAIQESPRNPPAAWLWQASSKILGSDLAIRAGGSFVWPPPGIDPASVDKVVFIAGGVGINAMEWNKNYIPDFDVEFRRFKERDLELALGPVDERKGTVAYVCGPPAMTDWAVGVLRGAEGMAEKRVLCEKWW